MSETDNVLLNKKGRPILPAKGDIAIGISGNPFFAYAGNFLSSDFTATPYFVSSNPGIIVMKYMTRDDLALVGKLETGVTISSDKLGNTTDPSLFDKEQEAAFTLGIGLGFEKFKSLTGRLRGYYGLGAMIRKNAYYGPSYYNNGYVRGKYKYINASDATNNYTESGGNNFSLSVRAVVGIEYFFAPKIALTGEFALGLMGSMTTDRKFVPENGNEVVFNPGSTSVGLNTDDSSSINLVFYF